jgi:hypothetical protein
VAAGVILVCALAAGTAGWLLLGRGGGHPAHSAITTARTAARTAASTPPPGVLVENGVGTPGLGERGFIRLVANGFTVLGDVAAAHVGYTHTQLIVFSRSDRVFGGQVAAAMRVPAGAVRVSSARPPNTPHGPARCVVVLGEDWRP